jgi:hypothetical protein
MTEVTKNDISHVLLDLRRDIIFPFVTCGYSRTAAEYHGPQTRDNLSGSRLEQS